MNQPQLRTRWLPLALCSILAACGSDAPEESTSRASATAAVSGAVSPLLRYIPDDSSYLFANTQKIDAATLDLLWRFMEPGLTQARSAMERLDTEDIEDVTVRALVEEVGGRLNRSGLSELGLELTGNFAFYGVGLLPVVRIELADPVKLDATIARIEGKSGRTFPRRRVGEVDYYTVSEDGMEAALYVGISGKELVLTVIPTSASEEAMATQLGTKLPVRSLADSGRLATVNDEYGLLPFGTFVVDIPRVLDAFLDDRSALGEALWADRRDQLTPQCKTELQAMAGIMPRVVSGYSELDEQRLTTAGAFELRSDIATSLTSLTQPVAGLGREEDAMLYFGLGLNILQAKRFVLERLQAISDAPYECAWFAELNEGATQAAQAVAQPLQPMVGNIQGIRLKLEHFEMAGNMPGEIRAMAMVGMTNPQFLLGMAQSFIPQLADLQINLDGEPVALPADIVAMVQSPYVAMMNHGFAVSIGEGTQNGLKSYLDAETISNVPFLTLGYSGSFMELYQAQMNTFMAAFGQDTMGDNSGLAELLDRAHLALYFTERGVEVKAVTYLKAG